MTDAERKKKIKELRDQLKTVKEENEMLHDALNKQDQLFKDMERVTKDKEFDFHCVKLNITHDSFVKFARVTKEFLIGQTELNNKLSEQEQRDVAEWYRQFFADATLCRDIVERLTKI